MTDKHIVQAHAETRTLHEMVITPDHVKRSESSEFRRTKQRLKEDGHYKCWVCGSTDNLQVHHYGLEWSLGNIGDYDALKEFVETFDVYGYGRLLRNKPITSPDDIRNAMVLCAHHHTGVDHANGGTGTGIHEITFPVWIAQKLCVENPVPQEGETEAGTIEDVKNKESM
ncbi:hypothetical protein [Alicyclobacillus acidoterrestris]|uniref:Uncharacterized protein n=1 Tax=Alicyclobacillus acidoterrestris (strain ATCC 49025 / DSM 3922 / CIP 106132 / NCIMB 13137 / GD3B) TaxID=1356854 RepID=T0DD96_ALIAG|nr:hypothetical protein [Alicyclobacillus acidoterrestris]EPZ47606.1 hypothetical protein N007_04995 [Alicyclobacillus acidoterrestris ATCC 49025]UNO48067.1 hypothetical protein K1I37_15445 [Alicyclobacillus acidoterrestris]